MDRLDYITKDRKGKHLIYLSFRKLKKEIKKRGQTLLFMV